MSYPPPPGLNSSQSRAQPAASSSSAPSASASASASASSLPARPPPSAHPSSFGGSKGGQRGPGAFTGFQPRSVTAQQSHARAQPTATSSVIAAGPVPSSYAAPGTYSQSSYQSTAHNHEPSTYYQTSATAGAYNESYNHATPPQIRNPFVAPTQSGPSAGREAEAMDPDMLAQIAQWQSAYAPKDDFASRHRSFAQGQAAATGANTGPLGTRPDGSGGRVRPADVPSLAHADSGVASIVTGADGKQKTVVRQGGGQSWQDSSLLEWNPAHFRLFVGNLAGEVTDDSLFKAFSKYTSLQKARVVRDKRTTKSKGYGFVSFADGDDYFHAARDMQGKYIGSHPVLLRKSTTEIRPTSTKDSHNARHKGHGKGGRNGGDSNGYANGSGAGGSAAGSGVGVSKKQAKTKGGLKILG